MTTAETVVELFRQRASELGRHAAVVHNSRTVSYQELNAESDALAGALSRRGAGHGTFVGVYLDRVPALSTALLGILKSGAAYVPFRVGDPADRIRRLLAQVGAARVVTDRTRARDLSGLPVPVTVVEDAVREGVPSRCPGGPEGSDLAYVMHTSGSTGEPKGVMIEHRGVLNLARWAGDAFCLSPSSRVMQGYPPAFDASVQEIFSALAHGATLCPVSDATRLNRRAFLGWMAEQRVSHCDIVPTYGRALSRGSGLALPDLRVLILGGEPLFGGDVRQLRSSLIGAYRVFNVYGPTEATVSALFHEVIGAPEDGPVPIGQPIPGVVATVLSADGRPCAAGEAGELHLAGAGVTRGYLADPVATARKVRLASPESGDGIRSYRTGDFVRGDDAGRLVFVGRADDQLSLHGYRIEPGEVEAALAGHPALSGVAVAAAEDDRLTCWYVLREPGGADVPSVVSSLRSWAESRLPSYMVPRRFIRGDGLPMTPTGKTDRQALVRSLREAGTPLVGGTAT